MGDGNLYPALLPVGFHAMSILAIRQLCVDDARFLLSNRRAKIMENLETLISGLRSNKIRGKVWIDGSFLTVKIEPKDVDILIELEDATVKAFSPQQQADIDWLEHNEEVKTDYDCDSHILVSWPVGHPSYAHGDWFRAWYQKWFGWDEFFEMKGIAVITL